MIYNCPNCMAALIFNPDTKKMDCLACGSTFDVKEFEDKTKKQESLEEARTQKLERYNVEDDEMMEYNIYSCTACGAELAVNDVEASTFCSYCGQPTIVFSRVTSAKKPKHIIPFIVTKDQAVASIRKHLSDGFFIPKEIRNFEIERVRGIYVPFWLYDVAYSDQQYLSGRVKSGKNSVTRYFFRSGECTFHNVTLDASKQLNDESSQRLEPYDTTLLTPFDAGYFSGFYADCFDMEASQVKELAIQRISNLFNDQIEKTVRASDVKIIHNEPTYDIIKTEYAMFPVWFLTFLYNDTPYTILANGQTGKVIGAVPFNKAKVNALFWLIGAVASFLATAIVYGLLQVDDEDIAQLLGSIVMGGVIMFSTGRSKFKRIKESIKLSSSQTINRFVKDRQEG